MCLGQCFEKGACLTTLPSNGYEFKDEGTRLRYRRVWSFSDGHRTVHGSTEWRSYFRGDTDWKENKDGSFSLKEHHNIELLAMQLLMQSPSVLRSTILAECKKRLNSPDLYDALLVMRLGSLIRRQWVTRLSNPSPTYVITAKGKVAYAEAVSKRFKF